MGVRLLSLAQAELDEAFLWYEDQVVGLGYSFLEEFHHSVKLIASFPTLYEQISKDIRRCIMNRFPYGIIYGVDDNEIIIIAVAHLKRKPNYWVDRN